jgi:hypothetical protein
MPTRKINAKAVAKDVHAGMGDTALMEKYDLTSKQLEDVLRRLVDAGFLDHMQLYERTSLSDSVVTKAFVDSQKAIEEIE